MVSCVFHMLHISMFVDYYRDDQFQVYKHILQEQ